MKTPICKLCKSPHWTYEEHKITYASEEARKVGADVLSDRDRTPRSEGYEKRIATFPDENPPETVTTTSRTDIPEDRTEKAISVRNKRTVPPLTVRKRGRPKKWASEAERLKAYRERK